jgi:hypothetical protein
MPKFRVISEPYRLDRFSPTIPTHRRIRGDESVEHIVTTVDAPDVIMALTKAIELQDHRKHSITSIEEVYPAEALYFTDEELNAVLRLPDGVAAASEEVERLAPEDYHGEIIYDRADFVDIVESVAKLLRATLLPGLNVSMVGDFDDNYTVIDAQPSAGTAFFPSPRRSSPLQNRWPSRHQPPQEPGRCDFTLRSGPLLSPTHSPERRNP